MVFLAADKASIELVWLGGDGDLSAAYDSRIRGVGSGPRAKKCCMDCCEAPRAEPLQRTHAARKPGPVRIDSETIQQR